MTRYFVLTFLVRAGCPGGFFYIGIYENRQGTCQSPRHPWAGCLTEILSYVVPFEKFSWCIRSEDFRINKRRLARLPHESALTYVVGFSVWFRFAPETNHSYVFYYSTCFRSITYYGPVDATPSACSREPQFSQAQVPALFASAKQP